MRLDNLTEVFFMAELNQFHDKFTFEKRNNHEMKSI